MAKSDYHANALLAAVGQGTSIHGETWVSLHTDDPGTTGASEVAGGNYARVQIHQDELTSPYWGAPSDGEMANAGVVTWPEGGDGDTPNHFGVWDASSGGNFLRGGPLEADFDYGTNVTPQAADGAIVWTES